MEVQRIKNQSGVDFSQLITHQKHTRMTQKQMESFRLQGRTRSKQIRTANIANLRRIANATRVEFGEDLSIFDAEGNIVHFWKEGGKFKLLRIAPAN